MDLEAEAAERAPKACWSSSVRNTAYGVETEFGGVGGVSDDLSLGGHGSSFRMDWAASLRF